MAANLKGSRPPLPEAQVGSVSLKVSLSRSGFPEADLPSFLSPSPPPPRVSPARENFVGREEPPKKNCPRAAADKRRRRRRRHDVAGAGGEGCAFPEPSQVPTEAARRHCASWATGAAGSGTSGVGGRRLAREMCERLPSAAPTLSRLWTAVCREPSCKTSSPFAPRDPENSESNRGGLMDAVCCCCCCRCRGAG